MTFTGFIDVRERHTGSQKNRAFFLLVAEWLRADDRWWWCVTIGDSIGERFMPLWARFLASMAGRCGLFSPSSFCWKAPAYTFKMMSWNWVSLSQNDKQHYVLKLNYRCCSKSYLCVRLKMNSLYDPEVHVPQCGMGRSGALYGKAQRGLTLMVW